MKAEFALHRRGRWTFMYRYEINTDTMELYIVERGANGLTESYAKLDWIKGSPPKPLMDAERFDQIDGVSLAAPSLLRSMFELAWEFGYRPKDAQDRSDELKAVRYHLEDMRTLALKASK